MRNAREELVDHIRSREVELVRISIRRSYDDFREIEGSLDQVLPQLDFKYDTGFGGQILHGFIWYADGTWSERGEYDGSEWWEYKKRPSKDIKIEIS